MDMLFPRRIDDTVDGSEFLHHLGCITPYKYWDKLPTVFTGAGFLPSTASLEK